MSKDDKIQKLLSVLDMTVYDQNQWLIKNNIRQHSLSDLKKMKSLADLAFRMRDEAVGNYGSDIWFDAVNVVCNHYPEMKWSLPTWDIESQPIHWIIAALIAKELK